MYLLSFALVWLAHADHHKLSTDDFVDMLKKRSKDIDCSGSDAEKCGVLCNGFDKSQCETIRCAKDADSIECMQCANCPKCKKLGFLDCSKEDMCKTVYANNCGNCRQLQAFSEICDGCEPGQKDFFCYSCDACNECEIFEECDMQADECEKCVKTFEDAGGCPYWQECEAEEGNECEKLPSYFGSMEYAQSCMKMDMCKAIAAMRCEIPMDKKDEDEGEVDMHSCKACVVDFKKNNGCAALEKCEEMDNCDDVDFTKFFTEEDAEECTSEEMDCGHHAFEMCGMKMDDHDHDHDHGHGSGRGSGGKGSGRGSGGRKDEGMMECRACLADFKKNKGCLALQKCSKKDECDEMDFTKYFTKEDPADCLSDEKDCGHHAAEMCGVKMDDGHDDHGKVGEKCEACLKDFENNKGCAAYKRCTEMDNCDDLDFSKFFKKEDANECMNDEMEECSRAAMKMCGIEGDDSELEMCKRDKSIEGKIFDVPSEGCMVTGQAIDCGAGYLTMQYWYNDDSCDQNKGDATSCHPIRGAPCDAVFQGMKQEMEKNGMEFKVDECMESKYDGNSFYSIVKCQAGEVDCKSDTAELCQDCKGMADICKDLICLDDATDPDCKTCKSCEFCKPYAKCEVNCETVQAGNCKQCMKFSEQCKDCEGKMDSEDCAVCKGCRVCKMYEKCDMQKADCESDDAKRCSRCKDCIACIGVEHEDCAKCEECDQCKSYVGCFMEDFCEENKDEECMKCAPCAKCMGDMKDAEECAECKECQQCAGFKGCFKGGDMMKGCTEEKMGPLLMEYLPKKKVKKCFEVMGAKNEGKMTSEECDCLMALPEDVAKENDCELQNGSITSMMAMCKKERENVDDCGSIKKSKDCNKLKPACAWKKKQCTKVEVKCNKIKDKDACDANEACQSKDGKKGFKCANKK